MGTLEDKIYHIWFSLFFHPGSVRAAGILEVIPSPKTIYESSESQLKEYGILTIGEITKFKAVDLTRPREIIEQMRNLGGFIITPEDEAFPRRLAHIYGPPVLLYGLGTLPDLNSKLPIAMVGTRDASKYGLVAGKLIASGLSAAGAVIISGMADGIDTICLEGAIEQGGKVVSVLGSGVDVIYPTASEEIYHKILAGNGAILSEHPPETPAVGKHFPVRNRILSGIAKGICVIEADEKSGSLITATHGLNQNRDVFAVPGSIFSKTSAGTNNLIKQGAKPLCHPNDVLEEYLDHYQYNLNYQEIAKEVKDPVKKPKSKDKTSVKQEKAIVKVSLPKDLSELEEIICTALIVDELRADEISDITSISIKDVLSHLTQLEIKSIIKRSDKGSYSIIEKI